MSADHLSVEAQSLYFCPRAPGSRRALTDLVFSIGGGRPRLRRAFTRHTACETVPPIANGSASGLATGRLRRHWMAQDYKAWKVLKAREKAAFASSAADQGGGGIAPVRRNATARLGLGVREDVGEAIQHLHTLKRDARLEYDSLRPGDVLLVRHAANTFNSCSGWNLERLALLLEPRAEPRRRVATACSMDHDAISLERNVERS